MRRLRDLPIQRKLVIVTMLTCGTALGLACAALLGFELSMFRDQLVRDLSAQARVLGGLSTAALSFNDSATAEETLKELRHEPNILAAALYRNGTVFAQYLRPGGGAELPALEPPRDGSRFSLQGVILHRGILAKGEKLGTIYLHANLRDLHARLQHEVAILVAVLLASWGVAWLFASRLHSLISQPVLQLADIASTIADRRDYSMRAKKSGHDEIGRLTDSFNQMIERIQSQDQALRHQFHVERLLSEVSSFFIHLPAARIQEGFQRTVRALGEFTGADRCYVLRLAASGDTLERVHQHCDPALADDKRANAPLSTEEAVWWKARLTDPHCVRVPSVAALSPEDRDAEFLRRLRLQSRMAVPLVAGVKPIGILGIDALRHPKAWDEKEEVLLRLIAQILVNASERERADRELETMHHQLVEASRQSGMAEVATGVLHNVGNVLNSVNISCSVVIDRLRQSRIANLPRVSALLQENAADLAAFFRDDPKGKQLPNYLVSLAAHLSDERQGLMTELELLRKNIDHIKDIVTMQQSYAKLAGVIEKVSPVQLVEDAIEFNAGALQRHEIHVVREFSAVPFVMVDKHKVIQILVNLIRNAKYALSESQQERRRLSLTVDQVRTGHVRIAVADNGVGIAAENLTRIFRHGFTTRKGGHGFGLHSGALAAKELGGSLDVQSDGPGKGATFTLELPVRTPTAQNTDEGARLITSPGPKASDVESTAA